MNIENQIFLGDNKAILKDMPDNYFDTMITDAPYGWAFMGKQWDYDIPNVETWQECFRVLKPGAHILVACGTRTQHRMAVNIEDAGFEIRDIIVWIHGQGFPKSLNIGKAVDKIQGNEREITCTKQHAKKDFNNNLYAQDPANRNNEKVFGYGQEEITKGTSQWEGYGTALKPSCELWTLARKPISEKNIAENVLKWGCGGLNIDAARIEVGREGKMKGGCIRKTSIWGCGNEGANTDNNPQGRYPANLVLSCSCEGDHEPDCPIRMLDEQSGVRKSGDNCKRTKEGYFGEHGGLGKAGDVQITYGDKGGASRFFYCSKASPRERNEGLDDIPEKQMYKVDNSPNSLEIFGTTDGGRKPRRNIHPTLKPLKLMEYLCKLTRPPDGGIVLDPFMGSGTTCVAAINTGRKYCGIELEPEYFEIAKARIEYAQRRLTLF